jgi:predicted nucleic acid-binding protein
MTIIVDANILISGIINPRGIIPALILENPWIEFVTPEYAIEEINLHKLRICKATKIPVPTFEASLSKILSHVLSFSGDGVSEADILQAEKITAAIDRKDIWYIAFAIAFDAMLWTGDLKLYRGLRRQGFNNIIITSELKEIIQGML